VNIVLLLAGRPGKPVNKLVQLPSDSTPGEPVNNLVQLPSVPARAHQTKAQTQSPSATLLAQPGNSVVALY
jgi:hypothetical protein